MKTRMNPLVALLFVVTLTAPSVPAAAYPPDNAAVLYYQAFMLYEADDAIKSTLDDYWHGDIELNETLEAYFAENRRIIDMVLDATRIDRCDWGLDYSQGTKVLLPPHHQARNIFFLIAGDATMQFDRGHPRTALQRCVAMYRMARHLNERPLICYLVGVAINAATHRRVTRFLSLLPPDVDTLTWFQAELIELDKQPFSIEPALVWKREAAIISMAPNRISDAVQTGLDDGDVKTKILERIRTADPQFYAGNVAYWNDFMDRVEAAFAMPYPQAYAELQRLDKKPCAELDADPNATLTVCFAPDFLKIHALAVRLEAHSDALWTAVTVYLNKARTGQLPETLPEGVPHDPFSGEPFQYERTADGFILRCRGMALDKNKAYEFDYKVKQ